MPSVGGWRGHSHMDPCACSGFVSPGLGRAHCFGYVLSTLRVGGASVVPWGIGPPRRPSQYISLASRPVVSLLLFSPCGFTSPGAGMETARLALGRPRGPPRWPWQGGLQVQKLPGASQRPLREGTDRCDTDGPRASVSGSAQDHSGEAAKEPERAQEHCLTNFAGGQHFFEYLLVVSLKKRRSGEDYEPTITYQFPKVTTEGGAGETEDAPCLRGRGVGVGVPAQSPHLARV